MHNKKDAIIIPPPPILQSNPLNHPSEDVANQAVSKISDVTSTAEVKPRNVIEHVGMSYSVFIAQDTRAYALIKDGNNPYVMRIGSRQFNNRIRMIADKHNIQLRSRDVADINDSLIANAEIALNRGNVWSRVAPYQNGIEIDLGCDTHARIRVTPGKVETITQGSNTFFYRTQSMLPMALPADAGDFEVLYKYLNMHSVSQVLFVAWLSYTLAHPKLPSSKYVILVLQGNQGSGKSSLCKNIILPLIDPNSTGVQMMPVSIKDLAIAVSLRHLACFDNVRDIRQHMADALCVAATGGTLTSRKLYTDGDQAAIPLHCAVVLNGIHSFIDQPDLAQRCIPIELNTLPEKDRKSEKKLIQDLNVDLPIIMRGLLELIAAILTHLPTVQVSNPERMIDFVHWLAAMELATNTPNGIYQSAFSDTIQQGQLDSLLDNTLASAVVDFATSEGEWSDTPANLLHALNCIVDKNTLRNRDWPQNPIALSKRLKPLQASLMTQGIHISFTRGKNRTITIQKVKKYHV